MRKIIVTIVEVIIISFTIFYAAMQLSIVIIDGF